MVAAGFLRLVEDYCLYSKKVHLHNVGAADNMTASAWNCPPSGCVKINSDAHILRGVKASLGVVLRDDRGALIATATKIINETSPEIAEAKAVHYGIQLATRLGYRNIWVECDALNVVRAVKNKIKGFSPIHLIFDDIIVDSSLFDFFYFSHVKRASNTVAHLVAKWDTSALSEFVCTDSFPQSITTLAELDLA